MNTIATTSTGLVRFFKTGVLGHCPDTDAVCGWIVVETEDTNPHEQVDVARATCGAMGLESVYARITFCVQSSADVRESGRSYAEAFAAASAAARVKATAQSAEFFAQDHGLRAAFFEGQGMRIVMPPATALGPDYSES